VRREPVLAVSVFVAAAIAVLTELGAGNIDSLEDIVLIALPVIGAAVARGQVTPVE
jgi:hypothetical protein